MVMGLLTVVGCKEQAKNSASEMKYALMNPQYSMLRDIEATKGKLPVCFGFIGFKDEEHKEAVQKFRELFMKAVNAWNGLLSDNPNWPIKSEISLIINSRDERCPRPSRGFAVNVWSDPEQFKREFCGSALAKVCASGARAVEKTIYIGPVNRGKVANLYSYFVVLHEFGHLLSLGDTYEVPGASEWDNNQPPSVMNGQNVPPDLFTEDDKMGVWAMLEAVRSGQRKCGEDTVKVDMQKNSWGSLICDPQAVPKVDHQSLPDRLMSDSMIAANSKPTPKPGVTVPESMGLTADSSKTELPIKEGLWTLEGFDPNEYQLLVQKIPGDPMAIRTTAFINGQSASSRGIIFRVRGSISVTDKSIKFYTDSSKEIFIEELSQSRFVMRNSKGRFLFHL
jgi:hypothetical protein